MLLCENKENLVEHGCKAFADIHLLEGAAEVTYTLPEVVEEGANFKEANFRAKKLSCMRLKGIGLCVTYCASFGMSTSEHFICNPSPDS